MIYEDDSFKFIRDKLNKFTIGIAGLGGLGSNAAVSLTRAGIGKLVLVDYDEVEIGNLNRQYYFSNQVGKPKTDAIRDVLLHIRDDIRLDLHQIKLEPGNMSKTFKDCDVIIEALDVAEIKSAFIEEVHQELHHIPLIAASGVAGFGDPDDIFTKKLGNLYIVYNPEAPPSEEGILMATRVSIMANWEADLAIQILLGEKDDNNSE